MRTTTEQIKYNFDQLLTMEYKDDDTIQTLIERVQTYIYTGTQFEDSIYSGYLTVVKWISGDEVNCICMQPPNRRIYKLIK